MGELTKYLRTNGSEVHTLAVSTTLIDNNFWFMVIKAAAIRRPIAYDNFNFIQFFFLLISSEQRTNGNVLLYCTAQSIRVYLIHVVYTVYLYCTLFAVLTRYTVKSAVCACGCFVVQMNCLCSAVCLFIEASSMIGNRPSIGKC